MKKNLKKLLSVLLTCGLLLCACASRPGGAENAAKIKVLIVPKFEIGEMSGDEIGEAQLLYEHYCPGIRETRLPHLPATAHFYFNEQNGVAILVTGSGKTACALALTALLSDGHYDLSDAFIVSVGCSGGSADCTTLGDIVLVTGACDNELGHTADIREFENAASPTTWFPDSSYDATSHKLFSAALAEQVYALIKDYQPQTTEASEKVLRSNFQEAAQPLRRPAVLKGSALSGDSYWKGEIGHNNAQKIVACYGLPDPYAVTEMEELTVANTAECYGLLDRVISLRAVVDLDVFLGEDSPESLWSVTAGYNADPSSGSSTALDIFEPAMKSLFEVSRTVIDAILDGSLPAAR